MAVPRRGDQQGMNFFLETARLQGELVHVPHLRRSRYQFEDFGRNQVIVQDDLGSAKHAHRLGVQEIGVP